MGDKAEDLAALGRFLDKINALLYSIVRKEANANFIPADANEILWYEVLKAVQRKHFRTHTLVNSYKLSISTLCEVIAGGVKTDYKSLVRYCVAEHRGDFIVVREQRNTTKLVMTYGPKLYHGSMDERAVPQRDDDEVIRRVQQEVVDAVGGVMARMRPKDADLLSRRYFDNRRPTVKQLADEDGIELDAMKKRLMRAEKRFSKAYSEVLQHDDGLSSLDSDHVTSNTAYVPQAVG